MHFNILAIFSSKKHRTKNLILARFRGLVSLNLVFLESQTSTLSISITYSAPKSPHGTCQGLRPWTRFYAVILRMGTNGLNQDLEILNFVIFDVFDMKYDQKSYLYSIFGTFSKFWYIINPFNPMKFSFFANFSSKNVVLRNGFWHDLEVQ